MNIIALILYTLCTTLALLPNAHGLDSIIYPNGTVRTELQSYSLEGITAEDLTNTSSSVTVVPIVFSPQLSCPSGCLDACEESSMLGQSGEMPLLWKNAFETGSKLTIVFTAANCDLTVAVRNIGMLKEWIESENWEPTKNRTTTLEIVAAIQLYGLTESTTNNDNSVRYAFNPYSVRDQYGLVAHRIHGADSDFVFREEMGCKFEALEWYEPVENSDAVCNFNGSSFPVLLELRPSKSTFLVLYEGWVWVTYFILLSVLFIYYLFHILRALKKMRESSKQTTKYGTRANFQKTAMILLGTLFTVRLLDNAFAFCRVLQVWVSEIIVQVSWSLGNTLAVLSFLVLVLYWNEVLSSSQVAQGGLGRPSQIKLLLGAVFLVVYSTVLMVLYTTKAVGSYSVLLLFASTGLTGLCALAEGVAFVWYGSRIISRIKSFGSRGNSTTKKLFPLTRLIVASAGGILITTVVIGVTFVSPILYEPTAVHVFMFILVSFLEAITFGLVLYTVTPLRRRNSSSSKPQSVGSFTNRTGVSHQIPAHTFDNSTQGQSSSMLVKPAPVYDEEQANNVKTKSSAVTDEAARRTLSENTNPKLETRLSWLTRSDTPPSI